MDLLLPLCKPSLIFLQEKLFLSLNLLGAWGRDEVGNLRRTFGWCFFVLFAYGLAYSLHTLVVRDATKERLWTRLDHLRRVLRHKTRDKTVWLLFRLRVFFEFEDVYHNSAGFWLRKTFIFL